MELVRAVSGNYSPRFGLSTPKTKIKTRTYISKEGLEIPSEIRFPMARLEEVVTRLYSLGFTVKGLKTPRGGINFVKRHADKYGYWKCYNY